MASRTALFSRKQSGGVFTISDLRQHPGDIWFVDAGSGTDGDGYGQNPDAPFATLDYAVGKCTASQGDVIYLMRYIFTLLPKKRQRTSLAWDSGAPCM